MSPAAANATRVAQLTAERRDLVARRERLTGPIAPIGTRVSVGSIEIPISMELRRCLLRDLIGETDLAIAQLDAALAELGLTIASRVAAEAETITPYWNKD